MKTPRPGIVDVALRAGIWNVIGSVALPLAFGARPLEDWLTGDVAEPLRGTREGVAVSDAPASASGADKGDLRWDCVND